MIKLYQTASSQAKLLFSESRNNASTSQIDIKLALLDLLYSTGWDKQQLSFFHGWMKKMDVVKTHYTHYQSNWKLANKRINIQQKLYQLSALMAMRLLSERIENKTLDAQCLKTCNVLCKILDRVDDVFGIKNDAIEAEVNAVLNNFQPAYYDVSKNSPEFESQLKTLPLTVLFSEGPIARAYLETIHQMGLKVQKIIRLVSKVDLVTRKAVGGFIPKSMKVNYAANKQYKQMFYWPNAYQKNNSAMVESIQAQVEKQFGFELRTLLNATRNCDLKRYSDNVEPLFVDGLKDPLVLNKIEKENSELFLYTGGGIVPDTLMALSNKLFIHIHPGYLPDIKGADCVLWSQLLTRRLSASAFFLAPGIDVGDVIMPCWLPVLSFEFPEKLDTQTKYRSIYSFVDPWVRSFVLRELIKSNPSFCNIKSIPQTDSGLTYHFMHEKIKAQAISEFN